MLKAISKVLVLTVMFFASLSQAMAFNTSMPCDSADDKHQSTVISSSNTAPNLARATIVNTSESLASDANKADDNHDDCCGIECCDLDCSCVGNTCNSVVYFSANIVKTQSVMVTETLYLLHLMQPSSVAKSLYRPPIFSS